MGHAARRAGAQARAGLTLRIGVLTTSYPRRPGDPAGGFVEGHVRATRALGHEVDVIAAGDPGAAGAAADAPAAPAAPAALGDPGLVRRVPASIFYRGGAPDRLERAPLRALPGAAAFTLRLAGAAAAAARARRWDAVVAHWLVPSALVGLAAARAAAGPRPLPLLAIAHGGDVHTLRRLRLLAPALRALHRGGARLAFVSEHLRAVARDAAPALAAWLDRDALVQPMGLDLDRFAAIAAARRAAAPAAPAAPPVLLVVARLVPVKGVDVALAALAHLAHLAHLAAPARLVIAGDGPERAALAPLAARAGAELLGAVDTTRRDALLRAASVVLVPSRATPAGRTEGMPTIALEALAAGVPVVASAVGGLRELPAIRTVPPDDPAALAVAIRSTLAAPPAPEALRAAVAHLAWRGVADRLLTQLRSK